MIALHRMGRESNEPERAASSRSEPAQAHFDEPAGGSQFVRAQAHDVPRTLVTPHATTPAERPLGRGRGAGAGVNGKRLTVTWWLDQVSTLLI